MAHSVVEHGSVILDPVRKIETPDMRSCDARQKDCVILRSSTIDSAKITILGILDPGKLVSSAEAP
jgi:hypothetical protein